MTDGHPVSREVRAPAEQVWQVLADGWAYAQWVVGASRVRAVDAHWPAEGSQIHHSVGLWPAVLDDTTQVQSSSAPHELTLRARAWPAGDASVVRTVTPRGPERSVVTIREDAVSGPGALLPKPLRQMAISVRNREALNRLALLAERRDGRELPGE